MPTGGLHIASLRELYVVVVAVITPPLPRDGSTAQTAIQVHAINLFEIRLGEGSFIVNNLIRRLNKKNLYTQRYIDDIVI